MASSCDTGQENADSSLNCDESTDLKYWWHVNKTGFPICEETWEKMWSYVASVHPEGNEVAQSIQSSPAKKVPVPSAPFLTATSAPHEAMTKIQTYLLELQYNYTGTQFFDVNKNRPLARLMELAKEIILESLPIKCLEAVVLALYLSAPVILLQRFPIGFKSIHNGKYHRHIVLGCYHSGLYGAIGLSRRDSLMYKPLKYKLLSKLLEDFIESYKKCGHEVIRIKIGAPVVHSTHSCEQIQWKLGVVLVKDSDEILIKKTAEKCSKLLRLLFHN